MLQLAYHASHEQFAPSDLLALAIEAAESGFDAIHSSDHFNPWSERQGHSGFSLTWLGAVMQATKVPVSSLCIPGQRLHPAVVAQAVATLGEMFPGRFSVELATGEALNEGITGEKWPSKHQRNQRLLECATVIRQMLAGETVTHTGLIEVKNARIWSLPSQLPQLWCAAISAETSGWCGSWADGLITISGTPAETQEKIDAFNENGGAGRPIRLQYSFSYAPTEEEALDAAHHQWRSNLLSRDELAELSTTADFDRKTDDMSREAVAQKIPLITSMEQLCEKLDQISLPGIELISLHNVNRNHRQFIRAFKEYKGS